MSVKYTTNTLFPVPSQWSMTYTLTIFTQLSVISVIMTEVNKVKLRTITFKTANGVVVKNTRCVMPTWLPRTRSVFTEGTIISFPAFAAVMSQFIHAHTAILARDVLTVIDAALTLSSWKKDKFSSWPFIAVRPLIMHHIKLRHTTSHHTSP